MSDIIQRVRSKYYSESGVPIGELFGVSLSKEEIARFNAFLEVSGRTMDKDVLSEVDVLSWLLLQENLEACNNPDPLSQNMCKVTLLSQDSYKYMSNEELEKKIKKLSPDKQTELRQNAASFLSEAQKFVASKAAEIKKERQKDVERVKQQLDRNGKRPPNYYDGVERSGKKDGC